MKRFNFSLRTILIPVLVESIRELQQKVAELESQLEDHTGLTLLHASVSTANEPVPTVSDAKLYQNTPNPFSTETKIAYRLPEKFSSANLYIYAMTGSLVKTYPLDSTSDSVIVSAFELAPGTYIYTLVVNGQRVDTKKMIRTGN
jgi:hypothetical protein